MKIKYQRNTWGPFLFISKLRDACLDNFIIGIFRMIFIFWNNKDHSAFRWYTQVSNEPCKMNKYCRIYSIDPLKTNIWKIRYIDHLILEIRWVMSLPQKGQKYAIFWWKSWLHQTFVAPLLFLVLKKWLYHRKDN